MPRRRHAWRRNSRSSARRTCRCRRFPATRRCRTTSSRRIPTSSRSAWARSPACRRCGAASCSSTWRRRSPRLPPRAFIDGHALSLRTGEALAAGAVPPAPDQRRLRQRAAGGGARRLRDPRLAVRRVPDGQRSAAAHRPVRRRHRQHPQLRPRDAALAREAGAARPAAGARVQPVARVDQGFPPPLPHALRGRPDAHAALSRRGRRPRAGRHRVLPAAVLRADGDAARLPAAARDRAAAGGP